MEYEVNNSSGLKDSEDLYQIALLIDQLKHDDQQLRLNAARNIVRIARALGPDRTRDELVPFLNESTDDEDEVLQVIAEKLGELVDYVGEETFVYVLLEPLELLVTVEESTVRDAAVKSIEKIIAKMPDDHLLDIFVPFISRLCAKDWFTSRISAAALIHLAYPRLPEYVKVDFRKKFLKLCSDETPMVRRMAAANMGNLAKDSKVTEVQNEFMEPFHSFSNDEQDSVRLQVVYICTALCAIFPTDMKISLVLPVVLKISGDSSWRVRWSLARCLPELSKASGEQAHESISRVLETLLGDTEAEVRSAATLTIPAVCSILPKSSVLSQILPATQRLVSDASEHVRASVAGVVNELASVLGRDDTLDSLLPMLLTLLRDNTSDVRLNIISNLDALNRVIGVEQLSQSLLPAVVDLAEDPKWRVRLAVITHIPKLAQHLGGAFFSDKLNALCLTWLSDDVHSVRKAAAENLRALSDLFGEQWCRQQILPRLDRMHTHTNFLQRMTALYGAQVLVGCLSSEVLHGELLPLVLDMAGDAVPNVRFTVAKTLQTITLASASSGTTGPRSGFEQDISNAVAKLCTDSDRDVRFFAEKAAKDVREVFITE